MVSRAAELGMSALGLTDHGVMYGAVAFYEECRRQGLTPIVGCELYVAPRSRTKKEGRADRDPSHLTVLALNAEGYRNLMALCTLGHLEGMYYKPRVDKESLASHAKGLVALSGCLAGEVATRITEGQPDAASVAVAEYRDIFGRDNFLLEMQRHGIEEQEVVNQHLVRLATEFKLQLIATNDLHYVDQQDAEAHDVLLCLQTGRTMNDASRWRFPSDNFYLKSPEQMHALFQDHPQALQTTLELAQRVDLTIELGRTLVPEFEVPQGLNPDGYLRQVVEEGIGWRYPGRQTEARERAEVELAVIEQTGFASYFLIVWDFMNYARRSGVVVGPGRGSAAGSLVAFCLGITNLDPLEHGLIFERFLNPERVSMPDIDIDFSVEGREQVINYVTAKYGAERVAQIITFATMGSKASVRDVARVLGVPLKEADRLAKLVPVYQGRSVPLEQAIEQVSELREAMQQPDQARLLKTAQSLEGVSRNVSTHAAGIVIGAEPLVNFTPLQMGPERQGVVTQYDMTAVQRVGLLKMDFLGLRNLDIISTALELVNRTRKLEIDISQIPLDDPATYDLIARGDTFGIFQLEGNGMRRLLTELRPERFADITAAVALFRPGPMQLIPEYLGRKHGRVAIEYLHEELQPILQETYGVMVYQEQVMMIARQLAGFTMGEADVLRSAMGKKDTVKMAQQREKFITGAVAHALTVDVATELFEQIAKFAQYGFNKSHSVAYALIAYQTAYLKCNYTLEYMTALLRHLQGSSDRVAAAVADCRAAGIKVSGPDVNLSGADFDILDGRIGYGLAAVKNVGRAAAERLIAERGDGGPFTTLFDLCRRSSGASEVNRRALEALIRSGACDRLGERAALLATLDRALGGAGASRRERESGQTSLLDLVGSGSDAKGSTEQLDRPEPMSAQQLLRCERELLGVYVTGHPLESLRQELEKLSDTLAVEVSSDRLDSEVQLCGMVSQVRRVVTRRGQTMAYLTLEDLSGTVEVLMFPTVYESQRQLLGDDAIVVVGGRIELRSGRNGSTSADDSEVEEPEQVTVIAKRLWSYGDPSCPRPVRQREVHIEFSSDVGVNHVREVIDVLRAHPGSVGVRLHFRTAGKVVTVDPEPTAVTADTELLSELRSIVGQGQVTVRVDGSYQQLTLQAEGS